VYGADDRDDFFAFADQVWAAQAADFSAVMIPVADVDLSDPSNVGLPPDTLADQGVCTTQRFVTQPVAGFCSGTLIAPDLLLTAGHCIDDDSCADMSFVFDYYMTDANTLQTITADDVYTCSDVVVNLVEDSDYSIVRLDRPVVGRTPAVVDDDAAALPDNRRLIVNGYPSGLPLKIDDGGRVRDRRADTLDFFVANLDTFGGNSGSGVFDRGTRELVGILVRGETDYVEAPSGCFRVNVCPNEGCRGEDSTYAFRAIEALCASGEPASGLCPCGDGTCDADGGENTATCAADCGTECGDGTCNGDESANNCTQDCGTCGNGTCDGTDTQDNCCTDCGCAGEGDVCQENVCIPDPGPGDTCELPFEIVVGPTQTIAGENVNAQNDFTPGCQANDSNDRVYAFTLDVASELDAVVVGSEGALFDTVLSLRTACADDGSELTCNDDINYPDNPGSQITVDLEPGTYYLVVDAFNGGVGQYDLTVSFTCNATTDTDEDGTPDCTDPCPEDPSAECDGSDDGSDDGTDGTDDGADGATDDGTDGTDDGTDGTTDDGTDGTSDDGPVGGGDDDDDGCSAAGGGGGTNAFSLGLIGLAAFGLRRRRTRG
jgi:MYXO-CTERM domain-containing protein